MYLSGRAGDCVAIDFFKSNEIYYASALANLHCRTSWISDDTVHFARYRLFFEGSLTTKAAGGWWALYGAGHSATNMLEKWTLIAELSFPVQ